MADTPTVIVATPEPKSRPYSAVLRNKRFRALWMSQFVSGLGDWLVIGLLIPLVTTLTDGSSFAVAGIMIAKMVPSLLFSSVIGVFVDRFDRRRLMIACDLVRALLTLFLLFTNSLAVIYMTVLLMEIASLFFSPARSALIPRLVAEEDVAVANGLCVHDAAGEHAHRSHDVGRDPRGVRGDRALGPRERPRRSWTCSSARSRRRFWVRARASCSTASRSCVSATLLWSIRVRVRPDRDGGGFQLSLIGKDALESFRFLGGHKELRGLLVTIGMAILGGGAIITVGLTYVQGNLAEGIPILEQFEAIQRLIAAPQTFMLVLLALGMVTGAILVPRLASRIPLQALFLGAVTVFGACMLVFASVGVYWVSIIFGFTAGFCIACLTVAGNTYVAQTVSDDIRGRVFTAMESVIRVSLLLSMVVVAPLADLLATLHPEAVRRNDRPLVVDRPARDAADRVAHRARRGVLRVPHARLASGGQRERSGGGDGRCVSRSASRFRATLERLRGLRAGTAVLLSGPVFTARDATHARLVAELERDGALPYGLAGQCSSTRGPRRRRPAVRLGSVGPTTAKRMDAWTPALLAAGIVATHRQGCALRRGACSVRRAPCRVPGRGRWCRRAARHEGGRPPRRSPTPTSARRRLCAWSSAEFPAWVAIDAEGNDLYAEARSGLRARRGG